MKKLSIAQVTEVKQLLNKKETQEDIAKQFGVSRSLISDIATGRVHKKVPPLLIGKVAQDVPTLEAEVLHLRTERSTLEKQLKQATRQFGLYQSVAADLEDIITPLAPVPFQLTPIGDDQIVEHLVMNLSDGHHDQRVDPEECSGLERYTFPISMRRGEVYVDSVIKWTQQTLAPNFRFPSLTVFAIGDHTSGEIHDNMQRSYFRNMFKNCFAIGQLHALMYYDLAPYFESINVVYLPGNHGRRSEKKDYHGAHNNWDYLIAEVARMHCKQLSHIHFTIPDAFSINLNIEGFGFHLSHGDDIRGTLGIPWYGLDRKQRRIVALSHLFEGPHIRYHQTAHVHRSAEIQDLDGEMLINGTWMATDSYLFNSFGGYTIPNQLVYGVHAKRGVTWRLPVQLKTEDEEDGPQRYKIDLANEVIVPKLIK